MTYLLPTLAVLTKEPPKREMFENPEMAGNILAALRSRLARLGVEPGRLHLAATPGVPTNLIRDFHRICGFTGSPQLVDIFPLEKRVPRRVHAEEHAHFVLLTDMVATGFTIDRAAMILERQGYHVDIALAVVDLRPELTTLPTTEVFSGVPVHCVVHLPAIARPTLADLARAELVDPGRRFSGQRTYYASTLLDEDTLLESAILHGKTHALGHFEIRADRHQTAVVDVMGLIRQEPKLLAALHSTIGPLVASTASSKDLIAIYYPEDDIGNSAQFAELVSDEALTLGVNRSICVPLERAHSDPGVVLVRNVPNPVARAAVLVDWGAVTTRTLRRSMALIADQGHERLHVILLTSQLSPDDLDDLARVCEIRSAVWAHEDEPTLFDAAVPRIEKARCSVSVAVVGSLPLPLTQLTDCWACAELAELHKLSETTPSSGLRAHVLRKRGCFEPRSAKDVLRGHSGHSFFEEHLSTASVGRALKVRLELLRASRSPQNAANLKLRLVDLSHAPIDERFAWLHLLALEPDWLKLLPLGLPECRSSIADLCVDLLQTSTTPERERWLAAMVLRAASKRHFLEHFPILLSSARQSSVEWELMLGLHTLMSRPYAQRPELQSEVLRQVREALRLLTRAGRAHELIEALEMLGQTAESRSQASRSIDLVGAWQALGQNYRVRVSRHSRVNNQALIVDDAINGPAARRAAETSRAYLSPEEWHQRAVAWTECRRFLLLHVLPHLTPIRRAISGFLRSEADTTPTNDAAPLIMPYESAINDLEAVSKLFDSLAVGELVFNESVRSQLAQRFTPWYRSILMPPSIDPGNGSILSGSHLFNALVRMPADAADCWEDVMKTVLSLNWPIGTVTGTLPHRHLVCDRQVFSDSLLHVVENAVKHRPNGSQNQINLDLSYEESTDTATISMRNSGTVSGARKGHGIAKHNGLLEHFGGAMTGDGSTINPWTYEAKIKLPTWN